MEDPHRCTEGGRRRTEGRHRRRVYASIVNFPLFPGFLSSTISYN
jgi:hypothetical protein